MTISTELLAIIVSLLIPGFGWVSASLMWAGTVRSRLAAIEQWQEDHGSIRERLAKMEQSHHDLRGTIQALINEIRAERAESRRGVA